MFSTAPGDPSRGLVLLARARAPARGGQQLHDPPPHHAGEHRPGARPASGAASPPRGLPPPARPPLRAVSPPRAPRRVGGLQAVLGPGQPHHVAAFRAAPPGTRGVRPAPRPSTPAPAGCPPGARHSRRAATSPASPLSAASSSSAEDGNVHVCAGAVRHPAVLHEHHQLRRSPGSGCAAVRQPVARAPPSRPRCARPRPSPRGTVRRPATRAPPPASLPRARAEAALGVAVARPARRCARPRRGRPARPGSARSRRPRTGPCGRSSRPSHSLALRASTSAPSLLPSAM